MPIRAVVNGNEIIAPDLTDLEWQQLSQGVKKKFTTITMHCCGNPGYCKVSKLGNRFFSHKRRGTCDWPSESYEHLKAKTEVYVACKELGLEAIPEYKGPDWEADLYVPGEKRNLAFEIQWSSQSLERTVERQVRYAKDNVRGIWLFQCPPKEYSRAHGSEDPSIWIQSESDESGRKKLENPLSSLPLFQLEFTEEKTFWVELYKRKIPLKGFVQALLTKKLKICKVVRSVPVVPIEIVFFPMDCWRCGIKQHCYFIEIDFHSTCGIHWQGGGTFSPAVVKLVRDFQQTEAGNMLRIGQIKERYSKTQRSSYMSFGCPNCDAIVGDWFIGEAWVDYVYDRDKATAVLKTQIELDEDERVMSYPHYCFPEGDSFCDGKLLAM